MLKVYGTLFVGFVLTKSFYLHSPGGGWFVSRGCETVSNFSKPYCIDYDVGGYLGTKCYCTSEQCNTATKSVSDLWKIISLAVVAIFVMLIQ